MNAEHDAAVTLRGDLVQAIRECLGLPENIAELMADNIARGLSRRVGGIYIPKREISQEDRAAAVKREFNGRNRQEVMRRHKISRATFYRIIGGKK